LRSGVLLEVDAEHLIAIGDQRSVMDDAFPLHALANARFAHKTDNAALQDAGTNARKNMIACAALKHDAFNPVAMQKLRQEQAQMARRR
jgi:hypothetical protein